MTAVRHPNEPAEGLKRPPFQHLDVALMAGPVLLALAIAAALIALGH
jgi:hypothetical protein